MCCRIRVGDFIDHCRHLQRSSGVAVDANGNLFVLEIFNQPMLKFALVSILPVAIYSIGVMREGLLGAKEGGVRTLRKYSSRIGLMNCVTPSAKSRDEPLLLII